MATLLPIPDDPRFPALIQAWPDFERWPFRSRWLGEFERLLSEFYPLRGSRDLRLTARHAAPFYLASGPNVP